MYRGEPAEAFPAFVAEVTSAEWAAKAGVMVLRRIPLIPRCLQRGASFGFIDRPRPAAILLGSILG